MTQPLCYVGCLEHVPHGVKLLSVSAFTLAHPREFPEIAARLKYNVWTNNTCVARCFSADRVMVCNEVDGKKICRPLSEHPKWKRWEEEFNSGEFWSMVGESWVAEESEPAHAETV